MARKDNGLSPYKKLIHNGQSVAVHVILAEKALGRPLPKRARVHHVDGNGRNNTQSNLVICPDNSYHRLLHRRTRALELGGNANYRLCRRCKKWDDPANGMSLMRDAAFHRKCEAEHAKECRRIGLWK